MNSPAENNLTPHRIPAPEYPAAHHKLTADAKADYLNGFSSAAIHAGYEPDSHIGSVNVPIYASTTYAQDGLASLRGGFEYGRVANPTVRSLETTLAALEKAPYARVFSSGMAATDTLLRILLRPGDHMILGNDAYGGTWRLIESVFKPWGVDYTVVNTCDVNELAGAIRDNTRVIWLETPTNPALSISDISAIAEVKGGASLVVDNTFASPYLQNPISLGADHVLHSTTKYLGGHSDVVGGAVVTADKDVDAELLWFQGAVGSIASPFDAYLTTRGIKTLSVRMDRHCDNAEKIAEFFQSRPEIKSVLYPGLSEHPGHETATKQMKRYGAMMSVRFHSEETAKQFCLNTTLFLLAESLGGVESLVEHPTSMTHVSAEGSELSPPADLVRLSIGIEDIDDLIADLTHALDKLDEK